MGGFINLAPNQTLYLHSHIDEPDSYGPDGESTVIASVIRGNTVPGYLVTRHHMGCLLRLYSSRPFLE